MTEDRPTMYNVALSYDFSTISIGVTAPNEELAEEEATVSASDLRLRKTVRISVTYDI